MSVTIHGIVCKNCFDVDWARRVEAEDKKKEEAEAAKKAKEWLEPAGSKPDSIGNVEPSSGIDDQPATVFDGALKKSAGADSVGHATENSAVRSGSAPSVNIVV